MWTDHDHLTDHRLTTDWPWTDHRLTTTTWLTMDWPRTDHDHMTDHMTDNGLTTSTGGAHHNTFDCITDKQWQLRAGCITVVKCSRVNVVHTSVLGGSTEEVDGIDERSPTIEWKTLQTVNALIEPPDRPTSRSHTGLYLGQGHVYNCHRWLETDHCKTRTYTDDRLS